MEADERKRKSGTDPGGEIQKGSTSGTAVGAKLGRTKGNKQEAEYRRTGRTSWETREDGRGEPEKRKRKRGYLRSRREAKRGKSEKEEREAE